MTEAEFFALSPEDRDRLVDEAVWGIDRTPTTPGDIGNAIFAAVPVGTSYPGDDYDYLIEVDGVRWKLLADQVKCPPGGWVNTWMWDQREGKPWQAALEKCVSAWRSPPSKQWTRDIAAALEIFKVHLPDTCSLARWRNAWCVRNFNWTFAVHAEAPVAICLAALYLKNALVWPALLSGKSL